MNYFVLLNYGNFIQKYGGTPTVTKIVKAFYQIVLDRPNLARYFVNIDMDKLIKHQIVFVCSLIGKPSKNDYDISNSRWLIKNSKLLTDLLMMLLTSL